MYRHCIKQKIVRLIGYCMYVHVHVCESNYSLAGQYEAPSG